MSIELVILRQGASERRLALGVGVAHVGRAEDNQVVLADVGVSRRHARLEVSDGAVVVEDLGSGNGTWFKGRPIKRQVLGPGEEVFIDPFTLRVAVPQPREPVEITAGRDATVPLKSGPPAATLTVVSAHKMPQREFPLPEQGTLTIGRSEKNGIVLPEPASSRVHAEITHDGASWLLRDFGSSNGTFVNGRRIKERHLDDGDRIRIGTVELRFGVVHEVEGTEAYSEALVSAPGGRPALPPLKLPPPPPPPTAAIPLQPPPQSFATAISVPDPEPAPILQPAPPPMPRRAVPPPPPSGARGLGAETDPVGAPPPAYRPAGAVELELDPKRARGRKLSGGKKAGGFLSRPINQISMGILAITVLMVTGKVASDVMAAMFRPSPAAVQAPTPVGPVATVPVPAAPGGGAPAALPVAAVPLASTAPGVGGPAALPVAAAPGVVPTVPPAAAPTQPVATAQPTGAPASQPVATPLAMPLPAAGSGADPSTTDPLMAEGMKAFAEARYFDAAGAFYRVLQVDPAHRDAKRMGYVACEFIALSEMRSTLVQRTTTDAARAEAKATALDAVAKAQAGTLPVAEARGPIEAALALTPDDAELVAAKAALDTKAASQVRAASAAKGAAQVKDLKAKLAAAQADLDAGKLAKAVKGFEAVMAADPTHSAPEYYQAQEGEQAAKDRMRTDSKAAWAEANAAIKVDDWLTARKRLQEVVSTDPYNDTAATRLAEAKKHLKESASEVYKEARVLEEMGQSEKALALYHKVQLYVGDESDPLYGKAQARMDVLLR